MNKANSNEMLAALWILVGLVAKIVVMEKLMVLAFVLAGISFVASIGYEILSIYEMLVIKKFKKVLLESKGSFKVNQREQ